MSLSGALSNAISGLTANARGTTVISANIANALNPEYGRRELILTTDIQQTSGGVRVAQVTRHSDPILAYQTRMASAEYAGHSARAAFDIDAERLIGSIDTLGSIAGNLTRFEAALLSAASDPSSYTRLKSLSVEAETFVSSLRAASDGLDDLRSRADQQIASGVDQINLGLSQLEDLNARIMSAKHLGQDTNGLMDQRDAVLDQVSEFVPLHVVERDSGKIAVFTAQGRTLLDESAVKLSFVRTPIVLAHMNVGNGLVSRLQIDGQDVDVPGAGMLNGGGLAAHFELRDVIVPKSQARLDGIARDVIERFGPGGPDTSLSPGDPGIFTDAGLAFAVADEAGLAGRVSLNAALISTSPELWRWRDGINAAVQGDAGNSDLLMGLQAQMSAQQLPGSPALDTDVQTLVGHLQQLSSEVASNRVRSDEAKSSAWARLDDARQATAVDGVNTDRELQHLIALEKAYAANARVVQVVDDMLSELLGI